MCKKARQGRAWSRFFPWVGAVTDELDKANHQVKLAKSDIAEHRATFAAERIKQHDDRIYDNFSFFLTLSTAIIGGLGYLAISPDKLPGSKDYWRVQEIAWGLWYLELIVGWFFAFVIALHYISLRRQWRKQTDLGVKDGPVPWWHIFWHVTLYMIIVTLLLPVGLYRYLVKPLFK